MEIKSNRNFKYMIKRWEFLIFILVAVTFLTLVQAGSASAQVQNQTVSPNPFDNWIWRNPLPQGNWLDGVTYGNNTFVAVGYYGTVLTSSDGVAWTSRTSGTDRWIFGVTYGNDTFVAVGEYGTILTSPDGVSWTSRNSGRLSQRNNLWQQYLRYGGRWRDNINLPRRYDLDQQDFRTWQQAQ